ncbi:hypothetical protein L1987_19119 [Smallanthus sonchifolius]|uniref:Uncharacterized protein n=1 Tax=Smallanthus sonchifolius TaxID=185202 RepID=A0ACB9J3S7_9ASTR|nr:hypothetical protein L1987_19119 [Smallanthus sonchifolius]
MTQKNDSGLDEPRIEAQKNHEDTFLSLEGPTYDEGAEGSPQAEGNNGSEMENVTEPITENEATEGSPLTKTINGPEVENVTQTIIENEQIGLINEDDELNREKSVLVFGYVRISYTIQLGGLPEP